MDTPSHEKKDLLIAWTRQCFEAAGLETSEKETRSFAATAAEEIIEEGLAGFAEGNSVAQKKVAGGTPVPGFIAYLKRSVPEDKEGRLDAFDEIFQRFIDLTASVEAAGETGVLANAAYNRSVAAANEILQGYFELRSADFVQKLHNGFGDDETPAIDMSKVTAGKAVAGGGCVIAALLLLVIAMAVGLLIATVLV
jgi:hypothetical protein